MVIEDHCAGMIMTLLWLYDVTSGWELGKKKTSQVSSMLCSGIYVPPNKK